MRNPFRPRKAALTLETLEDRLNPAPTILSNINLPGAGSAWDFSIGGQLQAAPLLADLNGNGSQEILVSGGDRNLYSYRYDPATRQAVVDQVFNTGGTSEIQATPVVADVPGVGRAVFAALRDGRVFAWNAANGQLLPGWPASVDVLHGTAAQHDEPNGVFGGLAAGDLDGDGLPEIVATSQNHFVTCFRSNGSVFWRFANDDTLFGAPAIGDLNGDGKMEVVIGGDTSQNDFYTAGGQLVALSFDGRREWVYQADQVLQSSPVLVDLDGDGFLEVVVGSGYNFLGTGVKIFAVDRNGNALPNWPVILQGPQPAVRQGAYPSPAVADLDENGTFEIVVGDHRGQLTALRANGTILWSQPGAFPGETLFATPVIADVSGDGRPDVVGVSGAQIKAFNGRDGSLVGNNFFPAGSGFRVYSVSPAVGRFKGDTSYQMVVMGATTSPSWMTVYDLDATSLVPPWAMFRQDGFGNAVSRPEAFATAYLDKLNLVLGRVGQGLTNLRNDWLPVLRHAPNLVLPALGILGSAEARENFILDWYNRYLNRIPGPAEIAFWQGLLNTGITYGAAQANFVGSDEAFLGAGNTNELWITFMYRQVLGRQHQNGEERGWVDFLNRRVLTRGQVTFGFFLSQEYTQQLTRSYYTRFAPGGVTVATPDNFQAAGWDLRRARTEESVLANLLASNGDYAATQLEGSWLRAIYNDLFRRPASQQEVQAWLNLMEGGLPLANVARILLGSAEYNNVLARDFYVKYLNRQPSAAELATVAGQLNAGQSRNSVIVNLTSSTEYFNRAGGTAAGYLNRVFLDLFGRSPNSGDQTFWLDPSRVGTIRTVLVPTLMQADEYACAILTDWFFDYLRRRPNAQFNSALSTIPDPCAFLKPFQAFLVNGGNPIEVQLAILGGAEYISLAQVKGFWTGTNFLQR